MPVLDEGSNPSVSTKKAQRLYSFGAFLLCFICFKVQNDLRVFREAPDRVLVLTSEHELTVLRKNYRKLDIFTSFVRKCPGEILLSGLNS